MGRPTITPADVLRVMGPSPTLSSAERGLCVLALERTGTIKHRIAWPTPDGPLLEVVR